MIRLQQILAILGVLLMAGCATPPTARIDASVADGATSVDSASKPAEVGEVISAVPITEDILFKILAAEIAAQRGHLSFAVENYVDLARQLPDARIASRATRLAVFAKQDKEALEAAMLWAEYEPTAIEAHRASAALLIDQGRTVEAVEYLETVLEANQNSPDNGFMLVATMLDRDQDRQSALAVIAKIAESRPDDPHAHFAHANIALKAGELDTALTAIDKAVALKPAWAKGIVYRAHILREQGNTDQALVYLKNETEANPKLTEIRMAYARTLVAKEQYEEAFKQLKLVLKRSPEDEDVLFAAAMLAIELDKISDAEEILGRVIRSGRRVDEAHYQLGQISESKKDYQSATEHYSSVRGGEYLLLSKVRIAYAMAAQGAVDPENINQENFDQENIDKAQAYLDALMFDYPQETLRLIISKADILRKAGRDQEAFDIYTSALETMPNERNILYLRAMIADKLGHLDITIADLLTILEADPDNPDILNDLGYTLADRTDRYDEAYAYISRALELQPDSRFILDSMGWVMFKLGDYPQAIEYLRKAMAIEAEAEIAGHLGEVLWTMGEHQEAREVWQKALDQEPDHQYILDTMKRLGVTP